jgi:DNA-directed RNA polymerase subunit RPC12/RpoP
MKCWACGKENPEGERFCQSCGFPDLASQPEKAGSGIECPKCGKFNHSGSFFCYRCGHYFEDILTVGKQAVKAEPPGKKAAREEKKEEIKESRKAARLVMPDGLEFSLSELPRYIERTDLEGKLDALKCTYVSRQHLLFTQDNGVYYVQDYGAQGGGSTNGTWLNGSQIRLTGKHALKDGDRIDLAALDSGISFVFKSN